MIALLRVELVKALKRMRTYMVFAIVIGIPVVMTIAVNANPPERARAGRQRAERAASSTWPPRPVW